MGETRGLGEVAADISRNIYDRSNADTRARMDAASRRGRVFAAFNGVVAGTREGAHVTGLHYLSESNELVVYLDGPSWTQEFTVMREIVRARMEAKGGAVDALIFRTSRPDYVRSQRADAVLQSHRSSSPVAVPPLPELTPSEEAKLDRDVAGVADPGLREALRRAERASIALSKQDSTAQPRE